MTICVYGAASDQIDASFIKAVEEFGEKMAKRGHNLVYGAGATGLMGAAARGVKKGGASVVGVIPEFFREERIEAIFTECDELIYTETMAQRKTIMEDNADAFVVVPGGIGTQEEFFQVLTLKQLGRHTKPIVLFDINEYYAELEDFLQVATKERFIREACKDLYFYSKDPDEILSYVENYVQTTTDVHELK
jgi:uncharacterized protein (TIGR00730 family)